VLVWGNCGGQNAIGDSSTGWRPCTGDGSKEYAEITGVKFAEDGAGEADKTLATFGYS
jgi:hypothetical protein